MQNAKDSFYVALRTRLVAINPERTFLLRSAVRPGIYVEEAEAAFPQLPVDVFCLRWLGLTVDQDLPSAMVAWDAGFWRVGPGAVAVGDG
jgi:hypothetical protein